jgi:hypothetical protein
MKAGLLGLLLVASMSLGGAANAQQAGTGLTVLYDVSLAQHYTIYGGVVHHINIVVSGHVQPSNRLENVTISFYRMDFQNVSGWSHNLWTIGFVGSASTEVRLIVKLPPGTTDFAFTVVGRLSDTSFLYRDAANIPPVTVTMTAPPYVPQSSQLRILVTPQTQIVTTFFGYPGQVVQNVNINGATYLSTSYGASSPGLLVLYQAQYRDWFLVGYLALILAAVGLSAPAISLVRRRRIPTIAGLWSKTVRTVAWLTYKRLLALFVLTSIVMVGVALVFGPSPTPKAYLAATPGEIKRLGPIITGSGYSYLTPSQASDQIEALTNLGTFHAIIVGDFPPSVTSQAVSSANAIVVIKGVTPSAFITLASSFYKNIYVANGEGDLANVLFTLKLGYSGNNIGLPISPGVYNGAVIAEAVLCLFVPFFGLAFFARYLIESQAGAPTKIAMALAASVTAFIFSETVYAQTAVLLGIPVGLHATTSSLETAGGILGYGGGSRPREVMGFLGFIFGVLAGKGGKIKLDRLGILAFVAVIFFLVADPLTGGVIFYQFALFAGTSIGITAVGTAANNGVEAFMNIFMNLFGSFKSQTFFSQHGTVMFFAGAIPFALYTRLNKTTATFLGLFCAMIAGLGFIRIANQDLDLFKVIASVFPGAAIGMVIIAVFLGANYAEGYLRNRLVSP